MSTPPIAPGWRDDPHGRRRWWDGQRWGAYAPWDDPGDAPRPSAAPSPVRLDRRLLHDPTAAASAPPVTPAEAPASAPLEGHERATKRTTVAYALLVLLGAFGAHRFYLGRTATAIAMLTLTVFGAITAVVGVGLVLLGAMAIWWVVDLFLTRGMVREHARTIDAAAQRGVYRGWPTT